MPWTNGHRAHANQQQCVWARAISHTSPTGRPVRGVPWSGRGDGERPQRRAPCRPRTTWARPCGGSRAAAVIGRGAAVSAAACYRRWHRRQQRRGHLLGRSRWQGLLREDVLAAGCRGRELRGFAQCPVAREHHADRGMLGRCLLAARGVGAPGAALGAALAAAGARSMAWPTGRRSTGPPRRPRTRSPLARLRRYPSLHCPATSRCAT